MSTDLAFTGPMGAGKSTVGRLVAGFLGRRFVDLDEAIERRTGHTVSQLFAQGEATFRSAEADALRAWVGRPADAPPEVVALGGGTLQNEGLTAALLRRARLIHLDAPAPVLAHRLDLADVRVRPLLASAENLLEPWPSCVRPAHPATRGRTCTSPRKVAVPATSRQPVARALRPRRRAVARGGPPDPRLWPSVTGVCRHDRPRGAARVRAARRGAAGPMRATRVER